MHSYRPAGLTTPQSGDQNDQFSWLAILCSQDWHPIISDADGYDILATRDPHILWVQVKAMLEPHKEKARSDRKSWKWTVGAGRNKNILIPTGHYDVLALLALEPNVIQFVNVRDVNKKTFRTKPERLHAGFTGDTWRAITDAL